jgi:hypothetical protein
VKHSGKGEKPKPLTNLEAMKKRGVEPVWPPLPVDYMIDWLFEIGPSMAGSMGEAPIGWVELEAWQGLTGVDLDPWEARTLRRLSRAYVAQRHLSEDPKCPEPRLDESEALKAKRQDVAERLEAAFRMLAAQQKPKTEPVPPRAGNRNRKRKE